MLLEQERNQIVVFGRKLAAAKLTSGTGGNLSIMNRPQGLVAISPSGMDYFDIQPQDVVLTDIAGKIRRGSRQPSSELGFHLALYRKRPDIAAVVHTHSIYATTVACLNRELPAVHYLVGFSGTRVPLAPYATYGSQALARHVAASLGSCNAVLLANHGVVTVGPDLPRAFAVAEAVEFVARIYCQAEAVGKPVVLPDAEMQTVVEKFKTYGQGRGA